MDEFSITEAWRPIVGWLLYDVSNLGRVRSWNNRGQRRNRPRLLTPRPDSRGYFRVTLCQSGAQRERFVHQLVLEHFVAERPSGTEGRHMNGNRQDNRARNLEWSTHAENMSDQYRHGTRARKARHGMAKLSAEQVAKIRELHGRGLTGVYLARAYGVSRAQVSRIVNHRHW